jgi:carbonic anhydrase/acetyltransferase-like protein (isoleucine patch superfamily)
MALIRQYPDGTWRACSAMVVGEVTIGRQSSLWFNVIVRGDVGPIIIGQRVNVQDGAIIHCDTGIPNNIEDDVSIAHGAICHGQHIGRGSLVGIRATLLAGSRIGQQCLIAAGAVVTPQTVVPDRHLAAGVPAKIIRPLTEAELDYLRWVPQRYIELAAEWVAGRWDAPAV